MPTINKKAYQFADLEFALSDASDGDFLAISDLFTDLNYSDNVEREKQRGAARVATDATDGEYDAEASATFHEAFFRYIIAWCKEKGVGFYDVEFDMVVNYRNKGEPLHTDTIKRVMFASRDASNSQGPSPIVKQCDLFIKDRIFFDGVGPFGETL